MTLEERAEIFIDLFREISKDMLNQKLETTTAKAVHEAYAIARYASVGKHYTIRAVLLSEQQKNKLSVEQIKEFLRADEFLSYYDEFVAEDE